MQGLGDARIAPSPEPLLDRERTPQSGLRLVELSLRGEARAQVVEHLGDLGALGSEARLADGERPPEERHVVPLAGEARQRAEADQGLGDLRVLGAAEPLADRQGFVEQRPGLVEEAERGMDAAQGIQQPRPQERLAVQIPAEAVGAAPQKLAGGGRRPLGLPRVRSLEQAFQEVRRRIGPRRLLLRPARLVGRWRRGCRRAPGSPAPPRPEIPGSGAPAGAAGGAPARASARRPRSGCRRPGSTRRRTGRRAAARARRGWRAPARPSRAPRRDRNRRRRPPPSGGRRRRRSAA